MKIASVVMSMAFLATPLAASAAGLTDAQVSAVIGLLQSFNVDAQTIATVKTVLAGGAPPNVSKPALGGLTGVVKGNMSDEQRAKMICMKLVRNVGPGAKGEDVRKLQELLKAEGVLNAEATGTFGPMTQKAMMRYQMHLGLATSSATGNVGPATRALLERRCVELKKSLPAATTTAAVQ